ncbi:unnamed protein product [Adineta steineri]|uniref:Uncharacterized protein n=1 Tax=Adineta steineri TaxID=433720 RepID=A0A818R6P6_9BILA|nr:unnamed protein product [Adineta steineri]CAF3591682.1 unnamed protein product [Adineta steineri]CAF3652117.1 unnamed protein product [Adineta steineri]
MMKRITQMLASLLFIITVLTIYLAFDFAINTAISNKYTTDKHSHHEQQHDDLEFRKILSQSLLTKRKTTNNTRIFHNNNNEHHHDMINPERRIRNTKSKQQQQHGKPAQFHKSKTGIKINHIKRIAKERRRYSFTTKTTQRKNIKAYTSTYHH